VEMAIVLVFVWVPMLALSWLLVFGGVAYQSAHNSASVAACRYATGEPLGQALAAGAALGALSGVTLNADSGTEVVARTDIVVFGVTVHIQSTVPLVAPPAQ
jgi:hypothetical protein